MPFLENLKFHSTLKFKTFLGDSEFDSYDNFGLLKHLEFEKAFIPLDPRNQANSKIKDLEYNIEGIPLCPLTNEEFKSEGSCKGKNRSLRFKFTCPKSHRDKHGKCYHTCENSCTDNKSGRMTYVYPGVQRNSSEWDKIYPIRAGLYLTDIFKLINVILAYAMNNLEYIRSVNKILKIVA